jgi:transcriptional regulator with XRE-family HTH domain
MARPLKQVDPDRSALHWLGHELRRWRTLHGISQKALGAQVGFSRVYISLVETAQERPTRQFVERCDNALATGGRLLALYAHVTAEHAGAWLDIPALRAATQQAELDRHETTRDPVIAVDEDGNVRRDQFLRLAGPAVAGMLARAMVETCG